MRLKFWAWIYRRTGYYSNYARKMEYEHLRRNWHIVENYMEFMGGLGNAIGLALGSWQAQNGFYRGSKVVKKML